MIQLDESPDRNEDDIIFEDFARLRVQKSNDSGGNQTNGQHTGDDKNNGVINGTSDASSSRYTNGSTLNFI